MSDQVNGTPDWSQVKRISRQVTEFHGQCGPSQVFGEFETLMLHATNEACEALSNYMKEADVNNQAIRVVVEVAAIKTTPAEPDFDGPVYDPALDQDRLTKQVGRVYEAMVGGEWWTLEQIQGRCVRLGARDPLTSISAQLRHLRKPRFGAYIVENESRGNGLYAYRLLPPPVASD